MDRLATKAARRAVAAAMDVDRHAHAVALAVAGHREFLSGVRWAQRGIAATRLTEAVLALAVAMNAGLQDSDALALHTRVGIRIESRIGILRDKENGVVVDATVILSSHAHRVSVVAANPHQRDSIIHASLGEQGLRLRLRLLGAGRGEHQKF